MAESKGFARIDPKHLEEVAQAERPPLRIRWWVIPAAAVLCAAQAVLNLVFESGATSSYLIATQISVIAFAFLLILTLLVNPLLRLTRLVAPLNRGEVMALFAALFVSAGISSFGLVDQLVPIIATPYNPSWNIPQRKWDKVVNPHLKGALYITDTKVITEFRNGFGTWEGIWRKIPWMTWARPLALWMIFVFAMYLMFYGLTMLLYDTWARREKLVFPLARMPEGAIAEDGAPPGAAPATFTSGLFWIGFIFVAAWCSFNGACQAGWIRGLQPIKFGLDQNQLVQMLSTSIFKGIADSHSNGLSFVIIFTAIGIGFLLPLEISRSLWAYYLIGLFMFLIAFWTAVGSSVRSFPTDWLTENNFFSSLGAGGLLAFAGAYLVKLAAERWADTRQRYPGPYDRAAMLRFPFRYLASFGWGGLLFAVAVCVALGWLAWCGIPLHWGLMFLAIVVLVTVGLMRVVAEGGVYWFQIHVSPFHLAKMAGGSAAVPGSVMAPLMPIYSVLFLDIKTFIAPSVMNSFKMQEETRASRRMFHAVVLVSILVTIVVGVVTLLLLVYRVGANRASSWFFSGGPQYVMDQAQRLASGVIKPREGELNWLFYLIGAGWVILSILMRRRFFWWLHPIGLAMLANPLMRQLWFSFFIGWLCKRIVVKYGGRHMFARVRPLFFGLMFGEVISSFVWSVLAQLLGLDQVRIDINRYIP